jgi:hypothetical protein
MLVEGDTVEIAGRTVLLQDKFLLRQNEDAGKCYLLPWKDAMMPNLVPHVPAHAEHKLMHLMRPLMQVNS